MQMKVHSSATHLLLYGRVLHRPQTSTWSVAQGLGTSELEDITVVWTRDDTGLNGGYGRGNGSKGQLFLELGEGMK